MSRGGITIRLDGDALSKLIEGNEDVKLQLQSAVVADFTRRLFKDFMSSDHIKMMIRLQIGEIVKEIAKDSLPDIEKRLVSQFTQETTIIKMVQLSVKEEVRKVLRALE